MYTYLTLHDYENDKDNNENEYLTFNDACHQASLDILNHDFPLCVFELDDDEEYEVLAIVFYNQIWLPK